MNKPTTLLVTSLAGVLALTGAGCKSNPPPSSGTDGPSVFPLPSSPTGFVDDPTTMVIGAWFAYGDSVGSNASKTSTDFADSDCAKAGFTAADCSMITAPTPGQAFAPTDPTTSSQCTSGTAALVLNAPGTTSADYSALFGAGTGLDFNNPGGDSGAPAGYFDLSKYTGIQFDFYADMLPTNAMRVNFPFKNQHGNDSPYWKGATMMYSPLTGGTAANPQHVQITWADVGGPFYLTQQTPAVVPPNFDPTAVQAIELQVFTNAKTSTPYSFCVANLALYK